MTGIGEWEGALARRYWGEVRAIPGVTVHGPAYGDGRRAPTVSITLRGATAEAVARRLAERAVQVWDGDFYAVRAVEVLGLAAVGGLLRTGFLLYNTPAELDRLLAGLAEIAAG
jgi:selenocysteine lyase/cysteine desulfurase